MSEVTITYLEMREAGELRPKTCDDPKFEIREYAPPHWQFNRELYFSVGEAWSWTDKRGWSDEQWREYVGSGRLRTFVASYDGATAGYYELHGAPGSEIEIAYFGLLPSFFGRGFGGALLTSALQEAWRMNPSRVWVHTCTLDHPASLRNYEARGMKIWKIESRKS